MVRIIPEPDIVTRGASKSIFGVNLAFDPSKSSDYNVLYVGSCRCFLDGQLQMEIYSSETSEWRLYEGTFTAPGGMYFSAGVFWNGAMNWRSSSETSLYFDIDGEKIQQMPMPPLPDGWDSGIYQYFGESGGHLHLIDHRGASPFRIHEMRMDHSGWFVKYSVDLGGVAAAFPEMIRICLDPDDLHYYGYCVLGVVREDSDDDDSYMLLHLPNKVLRYSFKDESFEKLLDVAPDEEEAGDAARSLQYPWFGAFELQESLTSV